MGQGLIRISLCAAMGLSILSVLNTTSLAQSRGYYSPRPPCKNCPPVQKRVLPLPKDNGLPPDPDSTRTPRSNDTQPQTFEPQFADTLEPALAVAGGGAGAVTPMLGRQDMNNRFNLFDNMSALPRERSWFGFQNVDGQRSGVQFTPTAKLAAGTSAVAFITNDPFVGTGPNGSFESFEQIIRRTEGISGDIRFRNDQNLYRFGAEWLMNSKFSIALQGQYVAPYGTKDAVEDWTSPELMFKHIVHCDCENVFSATFGIQFEVGNERLVISDESAMIVPGVLWYHQSSPWHFLQGGWQFQQPTDGDLQATDWALSWGFWAYKHESLLYDYYSCNGPDQVCVPKLPWIRGLITQIEVFGHHVVGDTTVTGPLGLSASPPRAANGDPIRILTQGGGTVPFNQAIFIYEEPKDIVDLTFGMQLLMFRDLAVGLGYTFPVTGGTARNGELLVTVTRGF